MPENAAADNLPSAVRACPPDALRQALRRRMLIRGFEERAEECCTRRAIDGAMHLSIGQEESAVGASMPPQAQDNITSTHRGRGRCIAGGGGRAHVRRILRQG